MPEESLSSQTDLMVRMQDLLDENAQKNNKPDENEESYTTETETLLGSGDDIFTQTHLEDSQAQIQDIGDDQWLQSLAAPKEDEFIFEVACGVGKVVACVRELEWYITQEIESRAFRRSDDEKIYFAGEYERRETLRHAIVWVADTESRQVTTNNGGLILRNLTQAVVDAIWEKYYPMVTLAANEANALYTAAVKYFRGEAQQGYPVPSLVVEVDYLLVFGMSRAELRAIKQSEMERIQLIRMARKDALISQVVVQGSSESQEKSLISAPGEEVDLPANMFPPGWGPGERIR